MSTRRDDPRAAALPHVARAAIRHDYRGRVTCGHCCSLAVQPEAEADRTLDLVAEAKVAVVTLPTVNLYLQDRGSGRTPRWRGVTLVHEMRRRGIAVAAAGDNCRDCFYAYGDHDMVDTFRQAVRILHLDHPLAERAGAGRTGARRDRAARPITAASPEGAPARLIVFNARTLNEIVSRPQADRIVIDRGRRVQRRACRIIPRCGKKRAAPAKPEERYAMLMHQLLATAPTAHPDKTRLPLGRPRQDADLRGGGRRDGALCRRAAHLGVRKGDRVTIFAHNGMDYLLGLFACWRIGAIAALVNIRFADELDYYFADHEPSVVIYTHDMLEPVRLPRRKAPSGAGAGLHGRAAARRAKPARSARRELRAAARSARRGRHRASFLHVGHHRQAEGRVPRARADHAGGELHRRAAADHQRRRVVRADRAVEFVSARRQSAAAAASRRDRQRDGTLDADRAASTRWSARRRRSWSAIRRCSTNC